MGETESRPESKRPRIVDRSAMDAQLRLAIGRRVRHFRERLNLSGHAFAALYGVHHTSADKWEKGATYPQMLFILWAWEQYQVPPEWLLVGDRRRAPLWLVADGSVEQAEIPAA